MATKDVRPWPALWALVIGFFMILIDQTIVAVANPSIQAGLETTTSNVIWVTSAYLLGYAVPLLVTGRMGDRFGVKRLYLTGLAIFTLASLWCGLADSLPGSGIANLIVARAVQGVGAATMAPQTMAVITRLFPAEKRGSAMALWGATAGIATLLGPLVGGLLVDGLGWEWIFFINVPIGIAGFVLACVLVPNLEKHRHAFDWTGVALSAVGMFLVVFALQEGNAFDWNGWVWVSIALGVAVLVAFVVWQRFNRREPLVPLGLFKDRNFSFANLAMSSVGFSITAMFIPLIYFFQVVRGMTPTESALMAAPMALGSLALAPIAGRLTDRVNPRWLVMPGVALVSLALWLYAVMMSPDQPILLLLIPSAVMGLGSAFMWGPLATTANRNLALHEAGAGSGVFNTTRQLGAVIGSAAIAALISNRLSANLSGSLPEGAEATFGAEVSAGTTLPETLHAPFTDAMSQTIMLPAAVILVALICGAFFVKPRFMDGRASRAAGVSARAADTADPAGAASSVGTADPSGTGDVADPSR
ncbi:MAG: DHA2 family efflux MFS transporter permease subunit [Pseudoclavibacter sp.]